MDLGLCGGAHTAPSNTPSLLLFSHKNIQFQYTVKPRIWNTTRSAAKVFHMRDLFHIRDSIFGAIDL